MRQMNQEEKTAEKYLVGLSRGVVKFEPDGNIPPDFSLASTIGIEVRRLNQNYFDGNRAEGLEERSIPLEQIFKRVLNSFDKKFNEHSYWVSIIYQRPLRDGGKTVAADMRKALESFLEGTRKTRCTLQVNNNIRFKIRPSRTVPSRVFHHAIASDNDSGGLVVQMYAQNIVHCIQEKEPKIVPYKNLYKDWWLLLVDTMMVWYLEHSEVEEVRAGIATHGGFNKIIVIDYFGNNRLLEIGQ